MTLKHKIFYISLIFLIVILGSEFVLFNKSFCVGVSMEPTIMDGEAVLCYRFENLDENLTKKIVLYTKLNASTGENYSVCHRVIEDNGDYLLTRGDNNKCNDPLVMRNNITGVVTLIVPQYLVMLDILVFVCCSGLIIYQFTRRGYQHET